MVPKRECTSKESEALRQEVEIHSCFNHKNILKLYSVLENNDYLFIKMELIEGGTLKELIIEKYYSNKPFFKESECSLIIKNILEGLDYIHSKKIMHRDIKPGIYYSQLFISLQTI